MVDLPPSLIARAAAQAQQEDEQEPERDWVQMANLVALALAMGAVIRSRKAEHKPTEVQQGILNDTIRRANSRMLPGAKMIRAGRPLTDMASKIKKKNRRALNSEYFKYRKGVKSAQKSLVLGNRSAARSVYQ